MKLCSSVCDGFYKMCGKSTDMCQLIYNKMVGMGSLRPPASKSVEPQGVLGQRVQPNRDVSSIYTRCRGKASLPIIDR